MSRSRVDVRRRSRCVVARAPAEPRAGRAARRPSRETNRANAEAKAVERLEQMAWEFANEVAIDNEGEAEEVDDSSSSNSQE